MNKRVYRIVRDVTDSEVTRITVEVLLNEGNYHVRETFFYTSSVFDRNGREFPKTSRSVTNLGVYATDYDAMRAADEWYQFNIG